MARSHKPEEINGKLREENIALAQGGTVAQKNTKRSRLWLNDGACVSLQPEYPGNVCYYALIEGRTYGDRKFRVLSIIDETTTEGQTLGVAGRLRREDVLAAVAREQLCQLLQVEAEVRLAEMSEARPLRELEPKNLRLKKLVA